MPGNIGPLEIGIVLVVALLVFGPKKLPELGHGLGKGMREFKDGITGDGPAREETPVAKTPSPTQIAAGSPADSSTSTTAASTDESA